MNCCVVCNAKAATRCSKCHEVFYCSRKCQTADWAAHKKMCGKVMAPAAKEESKDKKEPETYRAVAPRIPLVPLEGEGYAHWLEDNKSKIPGLMVRVPSCGLQNMGNSCYLNAAVQALSCTPSLQSVLDAVNHLESHQRPDACFLCAFEELSNGLVTSEEPIMPLRLQRKTNNKMFGDATFGEQADAQECIGFLLELLQESIVSKNGRTPAEIADAERHSMIGRIFGFDVGQCVYCTECGEESVRESSDMFLRLEITTGMTPQELAALYEPSRMFDRRAQPAASATSIKELIRHFHRPEALEDFKCGGCQKRGYCEKKTLITRWPNVLLVLLDQNKSTGMWGKVDREVQCQPFMKIGELEYVLYAMIVHVDLGGSTRFGHYVCFIHEGDGTWWLCDDSDVIEVEREYVAIQQPLFVLYQVLEHDIDVTSPKNEDIAVVRHKTIEDDEDVFLTARSSISIEEDESDEEDSLERAVSSTCETLSDLDMEEDTMELFCKGSVQLDKRQITCIEDFKNTNEELRVKETAMATFHEESAKNSDEKIGKEHVIDLSSDWSVDSDDKEFVLLKNVENKNKEARAQEIFLTTLDDEAAKNREKIFTAKSSMSLPSDCSMDSENGEMLLVENVESETDNAMTLLSDGLAETDKGEIMMENMEHREVQEDAMLSPRDESLDLNEIENIDCDDEDQYMKEFVVAAFENALRENMSMLEKTINENENVVDSPCDASLLSNEGEMIFVTNSASKDNELSMKQALVAAFCDAFPENKNENSSDKKMGVEQFSPIESSEEDEELAVRDDVFSSLCKAQELARTDSSETDFQHKCAKQDLLQTQGGSSKPGELTPDTRDDNTRTIDTRSCSSMDAIESVKRPRRRSRRASLQIWVPKMASQYALSRRSGRRHSKRVWMPKAEWVDYVAQLRR